MNARKYGTAASIDIDALLQNSWLQVRRFINNYYKKVMPFLKRICLPAAMWC